MKSIFVTGTDTGVGKTIVCGLLGRYLANCGYNVITQKWVQTGCKNSSPDINCHLRLMGKKKKDIIGLNKHLSPYTFSLAASPHLAAGYEKRGISEDKIKSSFRYLAKQFDVVIVEGAGGALVPFDRDNLLIDIARELKLPVLVVAANKLGAINHTLLTIEALALRKMRIEGIIFNNRSKNLNQTVAKDNPQIVGALTAQKILGVLPYSKNEFKLHKAFVSIGEKILAQSK